MKNELLSYCPPGNLRQQKKELAELGLLHLLHPLDLLVPLVADQPLRLEGEYLEVHLRVNLSLE